MDEAKTITPEQELQAFALFVMAKNRSIEAVSYEVEANRVLGLDRGAGGNDLSDFIYGDNEPPTKEMFDEALRRSKISVGGRPE